MKTICLILLALSTTLCDTKAQTQPPNAGFEDWPPIGPYENPEFWSSFNNFHNFGVPELSFKTSDAHSGSFALRLISEQTTVPPPLGTNTLDTIAGYVFVGSADMNRPGIAYTDRPVSLNAYIKGTVVSGNKAYVMATLRKWNTDTQKREQVCQAVYVMSNSSETYTSITAPFHYNLALIPDTLEIKIMAGDVGTEGFILPGNNIFVDDISFEFPTGLNELNRRETDIIIFPNPFSSATTIETNNIPTNSTLVIYNLYGQIVKEINSELKPSITISRDNLPEGIYFISLIHKTENLITKKLVITD